GDAVDAQPGRCRNGLVPVLAELADDVRADEPGAADDDDFHDVFLPRCWAASAQCRLCDGPDPAGSGCEPAGLDGEGEPALVADEHAAALERLIPVEPDVLAIELARGLEAGNLHTRRIDPTALELRLERGRAGDSPDGELAIDRESVAVALDAGAVEGCDGVARGVEEVGTAQVRVTGANAGVDAVGLDDD